VVETVTGERVTHQELGGADVHGTRSGVAQLRQDDEESCFADVRYLVSLLPSNNLDPAPNGPPRGADTDERRNSPAWSRRNQPAYDMLSVITELVDDGDFIEVQPSGAQHHLRLAASTAGW